ncbi:MAG: hypothetical protein ABIQ44_06625 [Chloroflexia bacterium]
MNDRQQLGEIIATSYSNFTVESYELNSTPPLGGLVVAENVIGVVCAARTEGLGPISAKGSATDEDGGVYNLYPDLQRTLRTNFTAIVVGCYPTSPQSEIRNPKSEIPTYTYPECPPRVHYQCFLASDDELIRFTTHPDYLRLILYTTDAPPSSIDQMLVHLLLRAYRTRNNDHEWLQSTAEYLGRQLKGQYDRLLALLKTLDSLTSTPDAPAPSSNGSIPASVGNVKL